MIVARERRTPVLLALLVLATAVAPPSPARAQGREQRTRRASDPEGRLIAFYSATMLLSPVGGDPGPGGLSLGMEATWIPRLSAEQRRPGIDKPESSNLSPVLPRSRLAWRAPGRLLLEGSWIPPLKVGDAKANLGALAVARTVGTWRGISLTPRLSAVAGRVTGAITCNAETAREGGPPLALYYLRVCHDRDSDDWFEPRLVAGELVASRTVGDARGVVYVAAGGRVDRTRFDIGVIRADGTRDLDHPVITLRDTRPHLAAGARWAVARHVASSAELFFAPGSLATIRVYAGWRR